MSFSCSRVAKVKVPKARQTRTLTEQHKAELRARRKQEAAQDSQRQMISSTDSMSSDFDDSATGFYVYQRMDQSRRCSVTVHSTRPPQRAKSLEACRPPPLVIGAA